MKDDLGSRMKDSYEDRYRIFLPRRAYMMLRIDGKSFHSYTRKFKRPFDYDLMAMMDATALALCEEIMGARIAYVQSDEISILVTDFDKLQTQAWFGGNLQKICSVSASIATAAFNKYRVLNDEDTDLSEMDFACFDSRVFLLADPYEVENQFIWRQKDAEKNSIQMLARSLYSHKQLNGKSSRDMHDMIHKKGLNWNDVPTGAKRGRTIVRGLEGKWGVDKDPPVFTRDRSYLRGKIPLLPNWNDAVAEEIVVEV